MKTNLRRSFALLVIASAIGAAMSSYAPTVSAQGLGYIRGIAFADANGNGKRDIGERALDVARFKITNGGNFWRCGAVFGETPFQVPVRPGTYFVMPIAGPGEYPTVPVIRVTVEAGKSAEADLPFGSNPLAVAENCGAYQPKRTARVPMGVVESANGAGLTTLTRLIDQAGLFETLSGRGPFTVFAPTDLAFAQFTEEELEALRADRSRLRAVLTYHVVPGLFKADQVAKALGLSTVNGKLLIVRTEGSDVFVGEARVIRTDITAANGVIHIIDGVLMP
ncbi:MAG: fasciclin domain-containing protein [Thermoflexales bacterium]|nr:fasciclin domain-containing protein [Thermoflexales bacterium]MDW8352070.1 fasciclin domain-containing protein [Anaerolineae bacterium]